MRFAAVALVCGLVVRADTVEDLAKQLQAARTAYNVENAEDVLAKATAVDTAIAGGRDVRVDAALLVAELYRIQWEQLPESNIAQRRAIGEKIDTPTEAALAELEQTEKNSEYYRRRADLLGVLIRSDFRAKKHRKDMESSAAKAIELDPGNARAYVSQAKPFVFAETREGGDPAKAIALLTKAIELDPLLEPAYCLRGLAHQKAGDNDGARADWQHALNANSACKPAADELKKLGAE